MTNRNIRPLISKIGTRSIDKNRGLKVFITMKAYEKMVAQVMTADREISSLGIVHLEGDQNIWVDDLYFIESYGSTASTVLDQEAVSKLMIDLVRKKVGTKFLRLWFHTHYNFQVFWSSTDKATAEEQLRNSKWTLSIVMNQSHELRCRLDIYNPKLETYDFLPVYLALDVKESRWDKYVKKVENTLSGMEDTPKFFFGDSEDDDVAALCRSRGIVYDKSDVKKIEPPAIKIESKNDKQIHQCSCGARLLIEKPNKKFKCPSCLTIWNGVYDKSGRRLSDTPALQTHIDTLYDLAIKRRNVLWYASDYCLSDYSIDQLGIECEDDCDSDLLDFLIESKFSLDIITEVDDTEIEAGDFINVGRFGHSEIYFDIENDRFHYFEITEHKAQEISEDDYLKNPNRYIPCMNHENDTVKNSWISELGPSYTLHCDSDPTGALFDYYYDINTGLFVGFMGTIPSEFSAEYDCFDKVDNRVIKNYIANFIRESYLPKTAIPKTPTVRRSTIPKVMSGNSSGKYSDYGSSWGGGDYFTAYGRSSGRAVAQNSKFFHNAQKWTPSKNDDPETRSIVNVKLSL